MRRLLALLLAVALANGCATISSGPSETIEVTSEPSGADVTVDCTSGNDGLTTPARLVIPRKSSDCTVTVQKAGFVKETVLIEKGVNRRTWGNIPIAAIGITALGMSGFSGDPGNSALIGGAIAAVGLGGLAIDAITSRLRDHDPKTVHVHLRPAP